MSGWRLSDYVVEDLLGSGGSGQVWRARVASTGESVALKRIAIDDAAQVRAAQAEAALLATLDHPHLVRLHELVPTAGAVVLVLDLAAGGTLAELIQARGRITPGEAITALAPIGAALAYAHDAGVVHADVTPSNVLFTEAGMPLLGDLGVARLVGDVAPVQSTPAFIDPAVAAGCVPGPQSDVFMLGAVTLHALTGRAVWPGDTPAAVLAAAASGDIREIESLLTTMDAPGGVRTVLARALSVEPSRRGSAADLALELRHAGTPIAVELSAGRRRIPATVPAPLRTVRDGVADADVPDVDGEAASTEASRPPFDRPRESDPSAETSMLTHAVRPRPRPLPARRGWGIRRAVSAQRTRRTVGRDPAARWAGLAGGVVALVGVAVVTWTLLSGDGSGKPASKASSSGTRAATAAAIALGPTRSTALPPSSSRAAAKAAAPLDAPGVSAVLARLDARRQQAFATRDAALLAQIYVPGALLSQDRALLERVVPAGCGLVGVRTTYEHIQVTAHGAGRVRSAVSATLADSVLICGDTAKGRAPGSGPTKLNVVLMRRGSDYLIAAISRRARLA
jgi:serine/threonine protein kinase